MAIARKSAPQSTHDRKVREIARTLEKQGYKVRADVRGREMPEAIGSARPDIEATRDGRRLIVEVETPGSLTKDIEQVKAFARHAAQKADTTLRLVITKPRKK